MDYTKASIIPLLTRSAYLWYSFRNWGSIRNDPM